MLSALPFGFSFCFLPHQLLHNMPKKHQLWGKMVSISLKTQYPSFALLETEAGYKDRILVIDFEEKDSDFVSSLFNKSVLVEYVYDKETRRRNYTKLEFCAQKPEKKIEVEKQIHPLDFTNDNQLPLFS